MTGAKDKSPNATVEVIVKEKKKQNQMAIPPSQTIEFLDSPFKIDIKSLSTNTFPTTMPDVWER